MKNALGLPALLSRVYRSLFRDDKNPVGLRDRSPADVIPGFHIPVDRRAGDSSDQVLDTGPQSGGNGFRKNAPVREGIFDIIGDGCLS